jgi:hypothetical protein
LIGIDATYFTFQSSDIDAIMGYLFRLLLVYIGCFIGTVLRDLITATKKKTTVDLLNAFLFSFPCSFIMETVYDIIFDKAGFGPLVLACVFAGMWSREIASLLMNNKFVLSIIKFFAAKVLLNSDISKDEKEQLLNTFEDAVGNGKKLASDEKEPEESTLSEEDDQDCTTAEDDLSEDTSSGEPEEQDDEESSSEPEEIEVSEDIEIEEDELGGDPEGEFSWINIIKY